MNRKLRGHEAIQNKAEMKARLSRHSPWFWLGAAIFLIAILTYVFSEDLSLRPRLHGAARKVEDRPLVVL